ncbi:MFS transporter [Burkholderia gladioli]|uniref:MFS transporter n=1 Tax=Burkholderia gladioli TaxID=28095 RepID=UPI001641D2AC|nr:MFS transporter [Burkholderia gladioli]
MKSTSNLSPSSVLLMAVSCGLVAASSYFAQPLSASIAPSIGLPIRDAGAIMMLSQLGYCTGLLLLAPLGDCVENRRLVLFTLSGLCIALWVLSRAESALAFLAAAFAIGLGCTVVQMIVPIAARMSHVYERGRVVGIVTSGLLAGIMLSRPVASLFTAHGGWRNLYLADALLLALFGVLLARLLPAHRPASPASYPQLLASLPTLVRRHALLRRLAVVQAVLFGAFSLFWGAAPFVLLHRFGLSPTELAWFALAGAAGALCAPFAGRAADRGREAKARSCGISLVGVGFVLTLVPNVTAWVAAAMMIDAGVQICHVVAQRTILSIDVATRNRLNSLYIATFFFGGALGSMLASWTMAIHWSIVAGLGLLFAASAGLVASGRVLGGRVNAAQ